MNLVLHAETDRARWLEAWRRLPAREPFAHPDFVAMFAARGVRPLAAVDSGVVFPFLLRDLEAEHWTEPGEKRRDVAVPYGYGGAFVTAPGADPDLFWKRFDSWALDHRVVCADARIFLQRDEVLPMSGWSEQPACDSAVVDLVGYRALGHQSFSSSVRRNIRLARRAGLTVAVEDDDAAWQAFRKIYRGTMDRRRAGGSYYFTDAFFVRLHGLLGDLARLFVVRDAAGEPLSGEVVLLGATRAYSYLAGSTGPGRRSHANELCKGAVCDWLIRGPWQEFVLGGGNRPDDALLEYKLRFAPGGRRSYSTGSKVYDEAAYAELVRLRHAFHERERLEAHVPRRFPAYR
ncbi:GNAT family N-acetyltransferase [Lentzea sp. JNUCC 0626]|uniref:GNAT family N-acetyltransferase n=1 Tax=Lentzea sp. JNUCC 0626 TaxID=3367513 RepID=UPI003747B034